MIFIKNQKGMTLVELLVSMGIFAVVMTITVGFFIVMQKMQMMYRDRANLQQEGRIASEIFSRYVKEAKTIAMTNSSGATVSELSNSLGLCVGGNASLTLTMADDTTLKFICSGLTPNTPNRLQMSSCTPDCFSDISSSQIHIHSLTINRSATATYPKTLKYYMEVEQFKTGATGLWVHPGEGEKIIFPGYLVMKNEL